MDIKEKDKNIAINLQGEIVNLKGVSIANSPLTYDLKSQKQKSAKSLA